MHEYEFSVKYYKFVPINVYFGKGIFIDSGLFCLL